MATCKMEIYQKLDQDILVLLVEHKSYHIKEEFCETATLGLFSKIIFDDREAEKGHD